MEIIKKLEKYSLTDTDIKKVFKPQKVNIVQYQDLDNFSHIDDLFKNSSFNFCVMFFPENEAKNSGHWTCIIKHKNGKYEYFDSYKDYPPDSEKKWLSDQLIKDLHIEKPLLKELFKGSGIDKVVFNPHPFQSQKEGVNDCGRHVCSRLMFHDMELNDYWKMIKDSTMNPDTFVTVLISKILGK